MRAKWMTFVLTTALVATGSLFAQQKHQSAMAGQNMQNSADRSFIGSAAEANLAEIDMAKMVDQKSTDPAVKDFANRMVTDHTQARQKLASVAEMNGVKLPTEETVTERNEKTELQKLSGAQLNDAYLRDELQGHKEAISAFESERSSTAKIRRQRTMLSKLFRRCRTTLESLRMLPESWGSLERPV